MRTFRQPLEPGKDKEMESPQSTLEEQSPANSLILAQSGMCQTSNLQNCKIINLCDFQLLSLWSFITATIKILIHTYDLPKFPGGPCLGFQAGSSPYSHLLACTCSYLPEGLGVHVWIFKVIGLRGWQCWLTQAALSHVSEVRTSSSHNMAISRIPVDLGQDGFWSLRPDGL